MFSWVSWNYSIIELGWVERNRQIVLESGCCMAARYIKAVSVDNIFWISLELRILIMYPYSRIFNMSRGWYAGDPFSEYVDSMAVMSTASIMSFIILAIWRPEQNYLILKVIETAEFDHIFWTWQYPYFILIKKVDWSWWIIQGKMQLNAKN